MWFKNIKIFQLSSTIEYKPEDLAEKLAQLSFRECPKAAPMSLGWVVPTGLENGSLVHAALGYMLICLNIQEKILPASVVKDETDERIKQLELEDERKLSKREKASIKDQMYFTLIQQAFCKNTKIFAYFDTKNNCLVVNCTNAKKLELFVTTLKKTLDTVELITPTTKNIPRLIAHWLLSGQYPDLFAVEDHAVLEDINNKNRVIRCRNQDLFADSIQNLIKDGCVPKQINLNWQERITFNLNHDMTLTSLAYADSLITAAKDDQAETEAEQFDANFLIMTQALQQLILDVLNYMTAESEATDNETQVTGKTTSTTLE